MQSSVQHNKALSLRVAIRYSFKDGGVSVIKHVVALGAHGVGKPEIILTLDMQRAQDGFPRAALQTHPIQDQGLHFFRELLQEDTNSSPSSETMRREKRFRCERSREPKTLDTGVRSKSTSLLCICSITQGQKNSSSIFSKLGVSTGKQEALKVGGFSLRGGYVVPGGKGEAFELLQAR